MKGSLRDKGYELRLIAGKHRWYASNCRWALFTYAMRTRVYSRSRPGCLCWWAAAVTWRPTASSASRLLPASAERSLPREGCWLSRRVSEKVSSASEVQIEHANEFQRTSAHARRCIHFSFVRKDQLKEGNGLLLHILLDLRPRENEWGGRETAIEVAALF